MRPLGPLQWWEAARVRAREVFSALPPLHRARGPADASSVTVDSQDAAADHLRFVGSGGLRRRARSPLALNAVDRLRTPADGALVGVGPRQPRKEKEKRMRVASPTFELKYGK